MESKEHFVTIPSSRLMPKTVPIAGRDDIANLLAFEIENLQLRRCVLLVLREELPAIDGNALQHGIALRNDFLPVVALEVSGIGNEHAIARRVFIAS